MRQAVAISEAELRAVHGADIAWDDVCEWSRREGRVLARRQERYGALVLDDRIWPTAPPERVARAALDGIRHLGLPWTPAAARFRARIQLARAEDWPAVEDADLLAGLEDWLLPHIGLPDHSRPARARRDRGLAGPLGWDRVTELDNRCPRPFRNPFGRQMPIDYDGDAPAISVRLQEMFGVTVHPVVGAARLPVRITLLSPAQAPVQVTIDLPGFWAPPTPMCARTCAGPIRATPGPKTRPWRNRRSRAKPRGT